MFWIEWINVNVEVICDVFCENKFIKVVFYLCDNEFSVNYEVCKVFGGGYGGLILVVFYCKE